MLYTTYNKRGGKMGKNCPIANQIIPRRRVLIRTKFDTDALPVSNIRQIFSEMTDYSII